MVWGLVGLLRCSRASFLPCAAKSCANASRGYLPTEEGFAADDSYEVSVTKVVKGSAEHMEEVYSGLLDEIWTMGNP